MPGLFWLVYQHGSKRRVVIRPAFSLVAALMRVNIAGQEGEFIEGHMLDAKMAKKVPEDLIGRALSCREAVELLKTLQR
jgi:hypothetical protein